jgi:hypothetical protein
MGYDGDLPSRQWNHTMQVVREIIFRNTKHTRLAAVRYLILD